jgi:hypothetical protein
MSAPPALRTLAFGGLDGTVWGAGWFPGQAGAAVAALGVGPHQAILHGLRPALAADGVEWQLESDVAALVVAPVSEAVPARSSDDRIEGRDQLCRVAGRVQLEGSEQTIDCLGLRTWWSAGIDLDRFESIRAVATWFEPDEALALTAFRARKAKAHDGDVTAGAVIGPKGSPVVEDPRLSTTYEGEGWPIRAGLELWMAPAEDSKEQFPRRASGQAIGPRVQAAADGGLEVRAEPFRWHSRGRDGAGMYILARLR